MDQVCGVLGLYRVDIDQVCGELAETAVILLTDTLTPALLCPRVLPEGEGAKYPLAPPGSTRGHKRVRVRGQDKFGLIVIVQFQSTGAGGPNPEPVHRPDTVEFDA